MSLILKLLQYPISILSALLTESHVAEIPLSMENGSFPMEVKFSKFPKDLGHFIETETMQEMLTSTVLAVMSHPQLEGSVVKYLMLLILIIPYVLILVSNIIIIIIHFFVNQFL